MGVHDKLAEKAASMGKAAGDFHSSAQKHANATWLFLIAAGAVWYFADWKWALIPAAIGAFEAFKSVSSTLVASKLEKTRPASASSSDNDFVSIVQAYGNLLATGAPTPGTVADTKKLPYPKRQIKEALVAALRVESDQTMRDDLKFAYISLADWQDGVGDKNLGLDTLSLNQEQDTKELAKQVLSAAESGKDLVDSAKREREALCKELEDLGL